MTLSHCSGSLSLFLFLFFHHSSSLSGNSSESNLLNILNFVSLPNLLPGVQKPNNCVVVVVVVVVCVQKEKEKEKEKEMNKIIDEKGKHIAPQPHNI